jgi:hypothetical protein
LVSLSTTVSYVNLFSLIFYSFSLPHNSSFQTHFSLPHNSGKAATLCSYSQLRRRFFLFKSWSSLSSTIFSKKSMGLGLGLGFVAAGAAKELMVVVLWRLSFGDGLWVCSVGLAVGLWVVAVGDG